MRSSRSLIAPADRAPAELPGLERPPTNRDFRLAGVYGVANASVCSLRAVCGRRSIPPLAVQKEMTSPTS
jgi:hypothetical protein